ncbi:probable chitinase 10 [Calliphora vicina]|uniref:probable chitinase 10 n=1 Tax=Calliphora vicina TaxID=7373 RepID=UPI00325B5CC2
MFIENKVFVFFAACTFCCLAGINADTFDECEDIDPDTYVASSESCSAYILCNGDDSELLECDEGEYFDSESESCDAKENVVCPLDNNEGEDGDGDEDGNGDGDGDEPEETSTAAPTTIATTTEPVTSATTTAEILDIPHLVKDSCPSSDDPNQIIYVSSNNTCSDYYVCYHGHPIEMHCTDHLHFNALSGKCDFPENSNCKISNQPPSATNRCLPHITDFFPHPRKCNYFFYCIKGYQTLQQCPFYYGWDIERRTCVHMTHAKCYDNTH